MFGIDTYQEKFVSFTFTMQLGSEMQIFLYGATVLKKLILAYGEKLHTFHYLCLFMKLTVNITSINLWIP